MLYSHETDLILQNDTGVREDKLIDKVSHRGTLFLKILLCFNFFQAWKIFCLRQSFLGKISFISQKQLFTNLCTYSCSMSTSGWSKFKEEFLQSLKYFTSFYHFWKRFALFKTYYMHFFTTLGVIVLHIINDFHTLKCILFKF